MANLSEWLDGWAEACHIDNGGNALFCPHDAALAEYITALREAGKSPSTISQAVAAIKWRFGEVAIGEITKKTLAGIRRAGKERGRGQVQGLTWQEVERVCSFAEASKTLAGLRDSAIINLMSNCLLRVSEVLVRLGSAGSRNPTLFCRPDVSKELGIAVGFT